MFRRCKRAKMDAEPAPKTIQEAVADTMADAADDFVRVQAAISRCAAVASEGVCRTAPELDRERFQRALETELWMAVTEMSAFARAGFGLTR